MSGLLLRAYGLSYQEGLFLGKPIEVAMHHKAVVLKVGFRSDGRLYLFCVEPTEGRPILQKRLFLSLMEGDLLPAGMSAIWPVQSTHVVVEYPAGFTFPAK